MTSWCSAEDVAERVRGNVPAELLQEVADRATSLLFTLSGRRFRGRRTVTAGFQVDSRGYVRFNDWAPVTKILAPADGSVGLSPGGTYGILARGMARRVVTISFEYGEDPPASGKDAAAALAADMLRSDTRYAALVEGTPAQEDVLPPSHITSITRQNVTYSFADRAALAREEQTGVNEVDLFLRAVNPNGLRHQPKVVAP